MHQDIERILVTEREIKEICERLGKQLTLDYEGKKPVFLGLLKGCVPFMSDIVRNVDIPIEIVFMSVSSYHGGIASSGDVKIKMDLDIPISGRDIVIVEDIVDTANTIVQSWSF